MKIKTWVDNLTDESSLWLNAIREEEAGNFVGACTYYLKNASESLKAGLLVRAALSSSCAAACLDKVGDRSYAAKLYRESGSIYQNHAAAVVGLSIREALWCLRQSHACFLSGNDWERAKRVYNSIVSLEQRIAPFSMTERRNVTHSQLVGPRIEETIVQSQSVNENVKAALEEFLRAERFESSLPRVKASTEKKRKENQEIDSLETSSFNQLG